MKNRLNIFKNTMKVVLCISVMFLSVSCEETFEFDLPEAGSLEDTSLPVADFAYIPDAEDFKTVEFNNLSMESIKYLWDFGGGATSEEKDPTYTFAAGEGSYPVTLTALDANNAATSVTLDVEVVDQFVALPVNVINGAFEDSRDGWEIASFTDGTTTSFDASGDGSWTSYDGVEGTSKTRGAKWKATTSINADGTRNAASRFAYQPIFVSPTLVDRTVKYFIEYEYSIETAGGKIIVEILDGHFTDGADAFDSTPLVQSIGTDANGKLSASAGMGTVVRKEFTTNSSGAVSIWIYGQNITAGNAYVDNVKVYPAN
ncbi:PKD domain-containing protein [Labilibaculum antarcticum]|uniref:PKD domain-containing protein n=1 Tax=Labilibaculum antarcticum TaxID=1717717 RepID=A0A1Y1CMT6_9BACT|nr:PKD domain-containing protein [Labilibaculum antarcticum]BAX81594.1 hypothetical protein ALGA_3294 [Labilibaculum antarcticum]